MEPAVFYWIAGVLVAAITALWTQNVLSNRHCHQENARLSKKVDDNHTEIRGLNEKYTGRLESMNREQLKAMYSLDSTIKENTEVTKEFLESVRKPSGETTRINKTQKD